MPNSVSVTVSGSVASKRFEQSYATEGDNVHISDLSVAAAKTGTLTTRTDANTGTLTMAGGHGITTSAKIDLFWDGGSRYDVTVGTVATNSVPIDLGSGDDLPSTSTAITACVHATETFTVDGDNVKAIMADSDYTGYVKFLDGSDAVLAAMYLDPDQDETYVWVEGMSTNPLAAADVEKIAFSNAATSAKTMRCAVVHS